MASYKFNGVLEALFKEESVGNFKFQKFWLKTDVETQYPQVVEFQLVGKNIGLLDNIPAGSTITIEANVRGKLFVPKNKVYNSLECWKLIGSEVITQKNRVANAAVANNAVDNMTLASGDEVLDDLPF